MNRQKQIEIIEHLENLFQSIKGCTLTTIYEPDRFIIFDKGLLNIDNSIINDITEVVNTQLDNSTQHPLFSSHNKRGIKK